jgi:hypothetical protein
MKASIWARRPGNHKRIWEGELPFMPREGDWICVSEEIGAAEVVHSSTYNVDFKSVTVLLRTTDPENIYEEIK